MRQTIGTTWVYQLVIFFILIFVAFLVLSLTYSKSFKTKNEIISILEKYEGATPDSVLIVSNYLNTIKYDDVGVCTKSDKLNDYWLGVKDITSNTPTIEPARLKEKYSLCIKKIRPDSGTTAHDKNQVYYELKIFFKFNLPILGDLKTFEINGKTSPIYKSNDLFDSLNIYY